MGFEVNQEYSHQHKCYTGHLTRLVFKSNGDKLGWIKICKRCPYTETVNGSFDQEGSFTRKNKRVYKRDGQVVDESNDDV